MGQSEPAVISRDLHSERTHLRQSRHRLIRDPGLSFDPPPVDRAFAELAQSRAELLAAPAGPPLRLSARSPPRPPARPSALSPDQPDPKFGVRSSPLTLLSSACYLA